MRCICYICGILYNVKEPFENDAETHGICDGCFPAVESQIKSVVHPIAPETKHKTLIPACRGTGGQSVRES